MQNILVRKSTPGRRAAKRDRAQRIGEIEQAIIAPVKQLFGPNGKEVLNQALESPTGQKVLVAALAGVLIGSGFVETMVDGWLGQ